MSNPLDSVLEALRGEAPRPEAVERAVAALRRPHPPRLMPLAVGVAVLSVVAAWPRGESGYALAQVVEAPTPARYVLRRTQNREGRFSPCITIWNDATIGARRVQETATVGPGSYTQDTIHSRQGRYVRRYREYATFTRKAGDLPGLDIYFDEPLRLIQHRGFKEAAVERDVPARVGRADRYTVERPVFAINAQSGRKSEGKNRLVAFVAPGTKRLLGWDYSTTGQAPFDFEYQTTVEYPDHFAPATFAVPREPGLRLYDLDVIRAEAARRLAHPPRGGLSLVVQDANRRVWAFWKGDAETAILGSAPAERVWTLRDYNGMGAYGHRSPYRAVGVRLPGQVERVDIRLGSRRVRNVPVLAVDNLETVAAALRIQALHPPASPKPMHVLGG